MSQLRMLIAEIDTNDFFGISFLSWMENNTFSYSNRGLIAIINYAAPAVNGDLLTNTIKFNYDCTLRYRMFNTAYFIEVYDEDGSPMTTNGVTAATYTLFPFIFKANKRYTFVYYLTSGSPGEGFRMYAMQALIAPSTDFYFFNGFSVLPSQFNNQVVFTTNSFGAVTLTFTSFTIVSGTVYNLVSTGTCLGACTVNITSSDATVFTTTSVSAVVGTSYTITSTALKSTIFTGTLVISITGLGVNAQIPLLARKTLPSSYYDTD